ncbi:MAG TPA: histidine--tRNA ligase [Anaerolineae bacterium]|nr:histidine--tRNA ligase [Anaerolineae bacterium]
MSSIQRATGMQDVLPEDWRYWEMIIEKATGLAHTFGFERVEVPILEYTNLFARGVGKSSDFFVQKEMYTIEEEDGEDVTMRPEFTASFMRSYIQNGMGNWVQPVKLYTIGPAFRRERPQANRFRQHSQFNAEIIGETDPAADVEIMMLARSLYHSLGYKSLAFQVNSTGCRDCKPVYVQKLRDYLAEHEDKLAPVDKTRLEMNPLRVLDSKEAGMDALLADAPHIVDNLCEDCAEHFKTLLALLDKLEQPYKINFRLVRGIDYYTKTVFEVWDTSIGAQAAIGGGGRYDGLSEAIGGPSCPGVGCGIGIERIVAGLKEQGIEPPAGPPLTAILIHFGGETKVGAVDLLYQLRAAGVQSILAFARGKRSMKSQMREANKREAKFALIMGEAEMEAGTVMVRELASGEQTAVGQADVAEWLRERA